MVYDLVVRGGTVVTATDAVRADVAIRAGRIVGIGESLTGAAEEIDATGLLVLPGGVDVHTHLDYEVGGVTSIDDFDSGTAAAACGGITTICDYAWQMPGRTIGDAIDDWQAKARDRAHVDYAFHVVLAEATSERLAEIRDAVAAGHPSFKVFMTEGLGLRDADVLRVLAASREAGAIVNVHAENGPMLAHARTACWQDGRQDVRHYPTSRPALAEVEATERVIHYAELTGAEIYVVHLSCEGALDAVRRARAAGLQIWAETRPIYLLLTDEAFRMGGIEAAKVVGAPPLRSAADRSALWAGLQRGDIQTIASDHTAWTREQKAVGLKDFTKVPLGVPTLETEMRLVYSEGVREGRLSVHGFVAAFSTNPARIFGFYPRKGTIAVGSDADLVLFDPERTEVLDERRLHSRAGYDPFHGVSVRGWPVMTLSRGEVIAREGELLSRPGRGRFVARALARRSRLGS